MLCNKVCGLNRVICKSKSILSYNVLDVVVLTDVTDDFVDDVFVLISRIWLVFCALRIFSLIYVALCSFATA